MTEDGAAHEHGTSSPADAALSSLWNVSGEVVKLRREPIDDATLNQCLDAAASALVGKPRCEFIVLRDADRKHQIARIYRQGWSVYRRLVQTSGADVTGRQWEADHFEDVPVIMVGCAVGRRPVLPAIGEARYYAAVFPAMQNLALQARALGLAATISTLAVWSGWQARRTLELPRHVTPVAVLTLGWPVEAVPQRSAPRPDGFAFLDRHGQPFPNRAQ